MCPLKVLNVSTGRLLVWAMGEGQGHLEVGLISGAASAPAWPIHGGARPASFSSPRGFALLFLSCTKQLTP